MEIPIFQPQDNPTRANFNDRIEAANAALESLQKNIGDLITPIPNGDIDALMEGRFSCTLTVRGYIVMGAGTWESTCTLEFAKEGAGYFANGFVSFPSGASYTSYCAVDGIPSVIAADMNRMVLTRQDGVQATLKKEGDTFKYEITGFGIELFKPSTGGVPFSAKLE